MESTPSMASRVQDAPPAVIPFDPAGVPDELKQRPQWVVWALRWRGGRWTKVPLNPATGRNASPTNPTTWGTFAQALDGVQRHGGVGIGFVLTDDDPYVVLDCDDCRDPETGALTPEATAYADALDSYTEVSPSGTGIHIFVKGAFTGRNRRGNVEMYQAGRYITFTGRPMPGYPTTIEARQGPLEALHGAVFGGATERRTAPAPQPTATAADDGDLAALLDRARRAKHGDAFSRLFDHGDTSAHGGDQSAADLALANHLAFWCGPDPARVDAAFRQSALMRAKWDERHYGDGRTYGQATVALALDGRTEFHGLTDGHTHAAPVANAETDHPRRLAELEARNAELETVNGMLRRRLALADTQIAIYRNRNLGAPAPVAAALIETFRRAPTRPDSPCGYRVPLAMLSDKTGLSPDTCSRQLKQLGTYTTDDGAKVLHVEVITVPETVNIDTGEIEPPRRELWAGPGVAPQDFGAVLATLNPSQKKQHGGRADRAGRCLDHPNAAVVKRTVYECAECRQRVAPDVTEIATPAADVADTPTRQDAALTSSTGVESGWPPHNDERPIETTRGGAATLMPHHAGWADDAAERALAWQSWQRGQPAPQATATAQTCRACGRERPADTPICPTCHPPAWIPVNAAQPQIGEPTYGR